MNHAHKQGFGEWWTKELDLSDAGISNRRRAMTPPAQPFFEHVHAAGIESIEGQVLVTAAIETYFPKSDPLIGLYHLRANLTELIGSAYCLVDQQGACLVTALHVIFDERTGRYREELKDKGLYAVTLGGRHLQLGQHTWNGYDQADMAITELSDKELESLGGALNIVQVPERPVFWIAFGYSASINRQRYRQDKFTPRVNRIGLYIETAPPKTFHGDASKFLFFKYDYRHAFDALARRTQSATHPSGHSGGLVAGYIARLACWIPVATIVEWHREPPTLVASRLDSVFEPR